MKLSLSFIITPLNISIYFNEYCSMVSNDIKAKIHKQCLEQRRIDSYYQRIREALNFHDYFLQFDIDEFFYL